MNRYKIMIIANDTTYTYNLRKEIIERLIADGHEVVVVAQVLLFKQELENMGCHIIDLVTNRHGKNPFSDLSLLNKYRKILHSEHPDIVLTYNIKPNIYGGLACRITRTHYLPNVTGLGTAVEYPGLMQKISTKLYKAGVAGAYCVFFQNNENKEFFIKHHMLNKKCKTRILPGSGVSLTMHEALEYPADSDTICFLFIARIMKEKGIDLYLDAAKRVYRSYKNVEFHICGQCDDKKYIDVLNESEKDGYVVYHGEQKDMLPFFKMAHCIVHPSYYPEGMSNVLLEAAAHCRPIITTDRAGCRETVDNGISGFIIPIKDVDALGKALNDFLGMTYDQKREMGLAGRYKIEKEFDRQIVVKAYMEEIYDILNK